MVFQSYALYPQMTARQNIALPLTMRRLSTVQRLPVVGRWMPGAGTIRKTINDDVQATANMLAIEKLLDRKPAQLSGGQRQRVAIGRAMVRQPKIFLMDEPLSNLDAQMRVQMRFELASLHRSLGATFVYVTHDQTEAMTMSDRVAVMLGGRLMQVASPTDIYNDPVNLDVAGFIGSPRINLFEGRVTQSGDVEVGGLPLAAAHALPGTSVTLGIRAENLHLHPPSRDKRLHGTVRHVEHLGADMLVHLEVRGARDLVIARASPATGGRLRNGDGVDLAPEAGSVLLFNDEGKRIRLDGLSIHREAVGL